MSEFPSPVRAKEHFDAIGFDKPMPPDLYWAMKDYQKRDDMDYVIRLPILQAMLHGNWGRHLPHITDLRSFLVAYKDAERRVGEILQSEEKEIL